jgi:hypothetical protein
MVAIHGFNSRISVGDGWVHPAIGARDEAHLARSGNIFSGEIGLASFGGNRRF